MANTTIDSSGLEYLESRRDKLRDIAAVLNIRKNQKEEQDRVGILAEEKLKEIKSYQKLAFG